MQIPRLTALLRAKTRTPESNGALDPAAAHAQRRQMLESYRRRQAQAGAPPELVKAMLGSTTPPKEAHRYVLDNCTMIMCHLHMCLWYHWVRLDWLLCVWAATL